jgi:hypothetical protein
MGWASSDGFYLDNIVIVSTPGALNGSIISTATLSGNITNTEIPVPSFTYTQANNVVTFTDTSINNPTSWLWNFGDGTTSTSSVATHSFMYSSDPVNVTLVASNSNGSGTATVGVGLESTIGARETNVDIVTKFEQIESCDLQYINISTAQASANLGIDFPFFIVEDNKMMFTGFVKRVTKQDNKPIWDVHAEGTSSYLRDKYTSIDTIYSSTSAATIINTLIGATVNGNWQTIFDVTTIPDIDYHVTAGSVLNHCVNIANMCGWEWDCYRYYMGSATNPQWGAFIFRLQDQMGTTSTATTLTNNLNIVNLDVKGNTDLVYTSVLANGISPSAANMYSIISANSWNMNALISNESYLSETISAVTTVIPIISSAGYPNTGIVLIDDEEIAYGGKSGNTLTGCLRQPASLGGAYHNIYSDVMLISELDFNLVDLYHEASGTIWIGREQIAYSERGTASMGDLTRGYNGTPKYSHRAGIFVRDGYYTDASPQTGTPVQLYGVRQNSIAANGVNTQNGVDLIAQRSLFKTQDSKVYGTATLRSPDRWTSPASLGSVITIVDKDGTSYTTRLLGIHYNQFKPIEITYGSIDEFILDDFAKLSTTNMNSMISNDNAYKTSVTSVSTINSKLVYVTLPDGTEQWVELT